MKNSQNILNPPKIIIQIVCSKIFHFKNSNAKILLLLFRRTQKPKLDLKEFHKSTGKTPHFLGSGSCSSSRLQNHEDRSLYLKTPFNDETTCIILIPFTKEEKRVSHPHSATLKSESALYVTPGSKTMIRRSCKALAFDHHLPCHFPVCQDLQTVNPRPVERETLPTSLQLNLQAQAPSYLPNSVTVQAQDHVNLV